MYCQTNKNTTMTKHATNFFRFSTANDQSIFSNTRKNFLSYSQCDELTKRGLYDQRLRDNQRIGVEDLFCMLPACITKIDDSTAATIYVLYVYKSAWDIPIVAYKNPRKHDDVLISFAADDYMIESGGYGGMVDALYSMICWVDDNYSELLDEFKWNVRRSLNIYHHVPMNDYHYIRYSVETVDGEKGIITLPIEEYSAWEDLMYRECDDECIEYLKNVYHLSSNYTNVKFIDIFSDDEHTLVGYHKIG